jgi:hypothetical protein
MVGAGAYKRGKNTCTRTCGSKRGGGLVSKGAYFRYNTVVARACQISRSIVHTKKVKPRGVVDKATPNETLVSRPPTIAKRVRASGVLVLCMDHIPCSCMVITVHVVKGRQHTLMEPETDSRP